MRTPEPARTRRATLAERERKLAVIAAGQHGVITRQQLLAEGLGPRTIRRRVEAGRLFPLHRGVFAFGHGKLTRRGVWLAAVLACGEGAVLSHRSAAALWGLTDHGNGPAEVTGEHRGRRLRGIALHECGLRPEERTAVDRIPITTVARTLLDLAEAVSPRQLLRACEEADRKALLSVDALERVCAHGFGRHGLKQLSQAVGGELGPATVSPLEDRIVDLCVKHGLPLPETNVTVLGREVDASWAEQKLVVEGDSFEFHGHRAAFERDRARDAAMQVAGFHVLRLTHRRLNEEPEKVVAQIRHFLDAGRAGS